MYTFTSFYFLSHLSQHNYRYIPCNARQEDDYIQIDTTLFFHPKTKSCLCKVLQTGSLNPIVTLLKEATYAAHVKDHALVHETFLLIFTVHKQILFQQCKEHHHFLKKTTVNTLVEVSDKINQLPIAEVLDAIDMLMTELPPFLEKYELTSTITWRNWLKKYWWVPPVFGGWFGLRILLNFQKIYDYDKRHHYSRPPRLYDTVITDPELLKITREQENQK
jgi:hypothetical protein